MFCRIGTELKRRRSFFQLCCFKSDYGVRKTTDFIEKLTWGLAAFMVVISVAASYVLPGTTQSSSVIMEQAIKEQATNPLNAPAGFAAPQTDAAETPAPAASDSVAQ